MLRVFIRYVCVDILDITRIFLKGKEGKEKTKRKKHGALLSFANEIYSFILENQNKNVEECNKL